MPDTEGPGRHCGAPSGLAEYGPVDTTIEAWFASDGAHNPPLGIGGGAGGPAAQFKRATDGTLAPVPACGGVTLGPGETLVAITCGGGGYGAPSERDPRAVRHAIREGLITPARADTIYGLTDDQGSGPPSIG